MSGCGAANESSRLKASSCCLSLLGSGLWRIFNIEEAALSVEMLARGWKSLLLDKAGFDKRELATKDAAAAVAAASTLLPEEQRYGEFVILELE